jgi:hypothetical protein
MEIQYPIDNLIPEIVSDSNMYSGYDYVISHLESKEQRAKYAPDKEPKTEYDFNTPEEYAAYLEQQIHAANVRNAIIGTLKRQISDGTFRITMKDVKTLRVKDGPKERECQAPKVPKRVGCHCIMVVIEKYTYPTLIHNTGASIKGRGMHWMHHIIEDDLRAVPEMFTHYYKNDISHYYDSISQERMKAVIRQYICDSILLPILDSFITLLPEGLSKGLRSSQTFGNLFISPVHHKMLTMAERYFLSYPDGSVEVRYLYYNYCDDTTIGGNDKKRLWQLRNVYVEEMAKLGLTVKDNEAVRPLTDGLDMVGYVHYPTHSLLRKRTKQNAARKLAKVKSRKRRQKIIGSFKGMACHADCKHLYFKLTHHQMQKFSEMGITYTPADGKKRFPGKVWRLSALQNKTLEVHDYESDLTTSHGDDRYLVSFRDVQSGEWGKFFTSSEEMKNILDQISDREDGFPFETVIQSEVFDGNKVKYKFT